MERRRVRSDSYQYLLLETVISSEMMDNFTNNESIEFRLNPFHYNDELKELEEQLKVEFWRIVSEHLTERQQKVLELYSFGKTQMEIAKILGVNQSSITKSLNGNVDYRERNAEGKVVKDNDRSDNVGKRSRRSYGGSRRRLCKIIESDEKIQNILNKMKELREPRF